MVSLAPQELIINASGHPAIHDEFMVFLIANSNSVGGFDKIAPGASIDDGLFDVIAAQVQSGGVRARGYASPARRAHQRQACRAFPHRLYGGRLSGTGSAEPGRRVRRRSAGHVPRPAAAFKDFWLRCLASRGGRHGTRVRRGGCRRWLSVD